MTADSIMATSASGVDGCHERSQRETHDFYELLKEHTEELTKLQTTENEGERKKIIDTLCTHVEPFKKHLEVMTHKNDLSDMNAGSDVDGTNPEGLKFPRRISSFFHSTPTVTVNVMRTIDCDLRGADLTFQDACKKVANTVKLKFKNVKHIDVTQQSNKEVYVLICPIMDRLGSSVDSAMRSAQCVGRQKLALVLFHHQAPHNPLIVESDQILTDAQYRDVGCMVDVVFWQNEGMYICDSNTRAKHKLVNFIQNS